MPKHETDPLLTVPQIQQQLGGPPYKSHSFVCRLLRNDEIVGTKIGREWRARQSALDEYLKAQRIKRRRQQQEREAKAEAQGRAS